MAVLVAASPTSAFYSQVAALRLALLRLRWSRWQPSLHLYVGGPHDPAALERWRPHLGGVHIHWALPARFALDGNWAQSDDVFMSAPPDADVLVALDADMFPIASIESMLDRAVDASAVAGVVAHYPTVLSFEFDTMSNTFSVRPSAGRPESLRDAWARLAQGLTDVHLDFAYAHTLMGPEHTPAHRLTPFYLNFGIVAFPRAAFEAIGPRYLAMRQQVVARMDNPDFSGQVALTLAIADARVRTRALPMRYNFPNDPVAEQMYPAELEQAVVFHYLRTDTFDRHQIFVTAEQYEKFLSLRLQGVNRRFQEEVRTIIGERYPFV